jgi:hypothetical protein
VAVWVRSGSRVLTGDAEESAQQWFTIARSTSTTTPAPAPTTSKPKNGKGRK